MGDAVKWKKNKNSPRRNKVLRGKYINCTEVMWIFSKHCISQKNKRDDVDSSVPKPI